MEINTIILNLSSIRLEQLEEDLAVYWDCPQHAHLFLALFLAIEELVSSGSVSTIQLGSDVFSKRFYVFAGDDFTAYLGLNRDFELLLREDFL